MNTYIALLRGINVGGNNKLPMKELVTELAGLGLHNIQTYIQSGNVTFQSDATDTAALAAKMSAAIKKSYGFEPKVMLLAAAKLERIIQENPFPEAVTASNTLHVNFLASAPPKPDLAAMVKIKSASERFALNGDVLYLYAPDGIGRSKLVASLERLLGVPMTSRNWNTVMKLQAMVREK
jgi:uncharacterized protein (DUF1697 family)